MTVWAIIYETATKSNALTAPGPQSQVCPPNRCAPSNEGQQLTELTPQPGSEQPGPTQAEFSPYLCTSVNNSQTLAPQHDAMLVAGVAAERIYEDLASGRRDDRPGLTACLKAIQPGNSLVLWKLDRLGRDLRHLVNTVEDLRTRGVSLKVLAGAGAQIATTTANGRIAFGIFAAFAEFERELIAERTMAGLKAARARGRLGGRPRKMDRATLMMAITAIADQRAVAAEIAKRLNRKRPL